MKNSYLERANYLINTIGNDLKNGEANLMPIMQSYFKAYLETNCFELFLVADTLLEEIVDIKNTNEKLDY